MPIERILLLLLILVCLIGFYLPVRRRLALVNRAKGGFDRSQKGRRYIRFLSEVILQSKVIARRPVAGLAHALVFWGFLAFALVTLDHFARGGFGFHLLGDGTFRNLIRGVDVGFAVLVLIGINILFIRRFAFRPAALGAKLSWTSGVVALLINLLMVTYLLESMPHALDRESAVEADALFANGPLWTTVNWWLHAAAILGFLVLIPNSKHLHLVLSPFTTWLRGFELAPLKPLDFENEEFGAETLADLGKFTALAAFTCVECGRCMDNCPANLTGKALDPKQLILGVRKGLLESGPDSPVTESLNADWIWQCTTCASCSWQCPVGVEHLSPILETRRGLVAEGSFPQPLTTLFKNLETFQNPYGYPAEKATEFLEENHYPKYEDQDTLYWMGCSARFDERYRKSSLAFKEKLDAAGVSYGVLYDEICTGDAARRAGNEFVFQAMAEMNIEMLNSSNAKRIVSTCPHCVRSLKEYRDFGLDPAIKVGHHSAFLLDLADEGRLSASETNHGKVVYHDACYLSRYGDPHGHENPRKLLESQGCQTTEAMRNRGESFCCGAGGAQLFQEETEGKRINLERTEELLEREPDTIVTSCPFCATMLRDGLAEKGVESVQVKDLAQL